VKSLEDILKQRGPKPTGSTEANSKTEKQTPKEQQKRPNTEVQKEDVSPSKRQRTESNPDKDLLDEEIGNLIEDVSSEEDINIDEEIDTIING